jgi:hypothetical protein
VNLTFPMASSSEAKRSAASSSGQPAAGDVKTRERRHTRVKSGLKSSETVVLQHVQESLGLSAWGLRKKGRAYCLARIVQTEEQELRACDPGQHRRYGIRRASAQRQAAVPIQQRRRNALLFMSPATVSSDSRTALTPGPPRG